MLVLQTHLPEACYNSRYIKYVTLRNWSFSALNSTVICLVSDSDFWVLDFDVIELVNVIDAR